MHTDTAPAAPATHKPHTYVTMVKKATGRVWYRADSAQWCDEATPAASLAGLHAEYPHLRFMVTNEIAMIGRPVGPADTRPWDTVADDDADVDLDALPDDEL